MNWMNTSKTNYETWCLSSPTCYMCKVFLAMCLIEMLSIFQFEQIIFCHNRARFCRHYDCYSVCQLCNRVFRPHTPEVPNKTKYVYNDRQETMTHHQEYLSRKGQYESYYFSVVLFKQFWVILFNYYSKTSKKLCIGTVHSSLSSPETLFSWNYKNNYYLKPMSAYFLTKIF